MGTPTPLHAYGRWLGAMDVRLFLHWLAWLRLGLSNCMQDCPPTEHSLSHLKTTDAGGRCQTFIPVGNSGSLSG